MEKRAAAEAVVAELMQIFQTHILTGTVVKKDVNVGLNLATMMRKQMVLQLEAASLIRKKFKV